MAKRPHRRCTQWACGCCARLPSTTTAVSDLTLSDTELAVCLNSAGRLHRPDPVSILTFCADSLSGAPAGPADIVESRVDADGPSYYVHYHDCESNCLLLPQCCSFRFGFSDRVTLTKHAAI